MIVAPGSAIVRNSALAYSTYAVGLVCLVAVASGGLARADGTRPVSFDVQVVHGSDKEAAADPRCEQIRNNLPIHFKSLAEVQRKKLEVALGQAGSLKLPSGRQIRLVPISIVDDRLHVLLKMEGLVESQLRLTSGRAVIVGGEPDRDGRIIITLTPKFRSLPAIAVTPALQHGLQPDAEKPRLPEVETVGHPRPR